MMLPVTRITAIKLMRILLFKVLADTFLFPYKLFSDNSRSAGFNERTTIFKKILYVNEKEIKIPYNSKNKRGNYFMNLVNQPGL